MKKALITGITGQVGSYLAEYLLDLGNYEVFGLDRRKSTPNHKNIKVSNRVKMIEGDITDQYSVRIVLENGFDEIYHLAAQSHVATSFEQPSLTFEVNAIGTLNLLEGIKNSKTKMYVACTSEMFGSSPPPQNENSTLSPQSPYGISKLAAFHMVRLYQQYGVKCSSGIMFNTESSRRGDLFVTKKIVNWAKNYYTYYKTVPLSLGNLYAKRDWMHARDAVRAIHLICNQDEYNLNFKNWKPYCFGSGTARSVKDFVNEVIGGKESHWEGTGLNEVLIDRYGNTLVVVDPKFYRPAEVNFLQCDYSKIKQDLGWEPEISFGELIQEMLENS